MKLDQQFWDELHPNVREVIRHAARYPSERNTCYAAGYIRGAKEFGGLLGTHYAFLLAMLDAEGDHANWHDAVKEFRDAAQ